MGISVPIGTDYYKLLKEISDERRLGLKRTLEFLVMYYNEKEKSDKASPEKKTRKISEEKHEKDPSRLAQKEKLSQTSSFQPSPPIDASVEQKRFCSDTASTLTSEIKVNKTSPIDTSESSTNSEQRFSPLRSESLAVEKKKFITPDNFFKQVSRSINQCCYSCGFPKKPNAKFCTNCGIHLKNTNENQNAYTIL
jgi:hypothetical protein